MKVVCRRIESATTDEAITTNPWLTVGREYDVLEVVAYPGGEILFRLLGDDQAGGPGLWDSRLFMANSTEVPASWVASVDDEGAVRLGPEAWQRDGFWEAYFDGEPAAVDDFRTAMQARNPG